MRFSIVCCTWDSMSYLPAAINSVFGQTFSDYELVFVDGGSTDGTLEYIAKVPLENKTILHDVRGGIARAMNEGLRRARGEIVSHLHSDDYLLHPGVLQRVHEHFVASDRRWLFGRILNDRDGALFPETYIPPKYSYERLLRANVIPHAATFVERRLFDEVGEFDESLRYAMDYDMWLRLGKVAAPLDLREAFAVFRRHEGSTTERNRLGSFDEDYVVRKRYASTKPWVWLEHAARYRVRRSRLVHDSAVAPLVGARRAE